MSQSTNAHPHQQQEVADEEDAIQTGAWFWLVPSEVRKLLPLVQGWRKKKLTSRQPITQSEVQLLLDAIRAMLDEELAVRGASSEARGALLAAFAEACTAQATFTMLDPAVQQAQAHRRAARLKLQTPPDVHVWGPPAPTDPPTE